MTEEKVYRCDYCRTYYDTPEGAKNCEISHTDVYHVLGENYHKGEIYPYELLVVMGNGDEVHYKRVEE